MNRDQNWAAILKMSSFAITDERNMQNHQPGGNCIVQDVEGGLPALPSTFCFIPMKCYPNTSSVQKALHAAVVHGPIHVAQKIIRKGVDLNAQVGHRGTYLHYAVLSDNFTAVCMLLYYGADVKLKSECNKTPLMLAFAGGNEWMITSLMRYYSELPCVATEDTDDVIVTTLDADWLDFEDVLLLEFSLLNGYVETFKLVWSRFDHEELLYAEKPFLGEYLKKCPFALSDWLQCLLLILTSPCALRFVDHYNNYMDGCYFFNHLLKALRRKYAARSNRIAVIYTCLSLGIEIAIWDIESVIQNYGWGKELEALIYAGNYRGEKRHFNHFSLLHFFCSLQEECSTETIFELLKQPMSLSANPTHIIHWFRFFAPPSYMRHELTNLKLVNSPYRNSTEEQRQFVEQLRRIPEVPSLLELSRNRVQKLIREANKIKKTYRFYDAVKNLTLFKRLEDIVLFKQSIY